MAETLRSGVILYEADRQFLIKILKADPAKLTLSRRPIRRNQPWAEPNPETKAEMSAAADRLMSLAGK